MTTFRSALTPIVAVFLFACNGGSGPVSSESTGDAASPGPGDADGGPSGDAGAGGSEGCTSAAAPDSAESQVSLESTGVDFGSGADGWRTVGHDIDGACTSSSGAPVCTLAPRASKSNGDDGNGGIDNGFGHTIVPLLAKHGFVPASATLVTSGDGSGTLTLISGDVRVSVHVENARVVAGNASAVASAVVPIDALVSALQAAGPQFDAGLCDAGAWSSFEAELRDAVDIRSDVAPRPELACDAVSLGVDLVDATAYDPSAEPPPPPPPNPCK